MVSMQYEQQVEDLGSYRVDFIVLGGNREHHVEEALGVTVNYISNGAYDEKVKSSATWTGVPSGTATLSADAGAANEFALKADDSGTLTSAVIVDATGVTIDDTGALTEEAGGDVTTNTLWLKLNATFTKAVYSGTITYIIADDS